MNSYSYDFGFGEAFEYQLIPVKDIESIPERQGIYSWFLKPSRNPSDDIVDFLKLSSTRSLKVCAEGNLSEVYTGNLERQFSESSLPSDAITTAAFSLFSSPLYIGISKNLKVRIRQHHQALQKYLSNPKSYEGTNDCNDNQDDEVESSYFGERLGKLLIDSGYSHSSNIFLKLLFADNLSRNDLLCLERCLNTTVNPKLGRK